MAPLRRIPEYSALLLTLLALLLIPPFLPETLAGQRLIGVVTSLVLIVGALSLRRRLMMMTAGLVALPALISSWLAYGLDSSSIHLFGLCLRCAFFAVMICTISIDVWSQREVSADTIAGAAAGYILLALFWAALYGIVEAIEPGSFVFPEHPSWAGDWSSGAGNASSTSFAYFSFVTITTLGYGDMAPVTPEAGMLAAAEATAGQLYIAVLIARLVALNVASR